MIDDLYSARILSLAANLPHAGRLAEPQGTGEAVARPCGSRAVVDVTLDADGRVESFAQDIKACALGQAAAGVLGQAVIGATLDEIEGARDAMTAMLKSGGLGPAERFEGLRVLKPVADHPSRHASTMVALDATAEAVRRARAFIPSPACGGSVASPTKSASDDGGSPLQNSLSDPGSAAPIDGPPLPQAGEGRIGRP